MYLDDRLLANQARLMTHSCLQIPLPMHRHTNESCLDLPSAPGWSAFFRSHALIAYGNINFGMVAQHVTALPLPR